MKKTILITLCLLPLSFGCIPTVVNNIPTSSPSIVEVTPSNMEVSPTATIPPIYPTPKPTPNPLDGYELYSNVVGCLPIDPNLKAKLDYPVDLAVTKDGKKIYVVNLRKELNVSKYALSLTGSTNQNTVVNRQYIYEIKDDKSISAVKINGEYPFSCQLGEDVEIDNSDNLYVLRHVSNPPYLNYEIHKISPNMTMSLYNKITIDTGGDIKPGTIMNTPSVSKPNILNNLHIDNEGSIFYMLRSGSSDYGNVDILSKLYKDGSTDKILNYNTGAINDFSIRDKEVHIINLISLDGKFYIQKINFPIINRGDNIMNLIEPNKTNEYN